MKILITGGCGFVGSSIAIYLKKKILNAKIDTLDNLSQPGFEKGGQPDEDVEINMEPSAPEGFAI